MVMVCGLWSSQRYCEIFTGFDADQTSQASRGLTILTHNHHLGLYFVRRRDRLGYKKGPEMARYGRSTFPKLGDATSNGAAPNSGTSSCELSSMLGIVRDSRVR